MLRFVSEGHNSAVILETIQSRFCNMATIRRSIISPQKDMLWVLIRSALPHLSTDTYIVGNC